MALRSLDPKLHRDIHPVLRSCHQNDIEGVRDYLQKGGDAYVEHEHHSGLMSTVVTGGFPEIMKLLLEYGYDPNRPFGEFGQRPLHRIGSVPNCMEMARLLLGHGADPNIQDKYGSTPIQCAASSGNLEYLELLLAAGADPAYVSPDGQDAFYAAVVSSRRECAEFLLKLGGDVNMQDDRGRTALSRIAMGGRGVEMIKWLLAHGADKSIPDENGDTALDWARENGHAEIVKLLE